MTDVADRARALLGDLWDDDVDAAVARSPQSSAAVVGLLAAPPASIEDGLVAESLVYADLQSGPEFAAWLAAGQAQDAQRQAKKDARAKARGKGSGVRALGGNGGDGGHGGHGDDVRLDSDV